MSSYITTIQVQVVELVVGVVELEVVEVELELVETNNAYLFLTIRGSLQ